MTDGKLDEVRREADAWKAQLDARVRVQEESWVRRFGIPTLLARLADVATVAAGIWLISTLHLILAPVGVLFVLGGLFGFLRAMGGEE